MELEIVELITRIPVTVPLSLIETSLLYLEVALFSICRFLTCFSVLLYQKRSFTLNLFCNNYGCFQNSTVLVYNTKRAYYYVCPLDLEYYFCPQFAFFNHPSTKNEI